MMEHDDGCQQRSNASHNRSSDGDNNGAIVLLRMANDNDASPPHRDWCTAPTVKRPTPSDPGGQPDTCQASVVDTKNAQPPPRPHDGAGANGFHEETATAAHAKLLAVDVTNSFNHDRRWTTPLPSMDFGEKQQEEPARAF